MISLKIMPVARLEGPTGSFELRTVPRGLVRVGPKSRKRAVAVALSFSLLTAKPRYSVAGRPDSVAEPS